MACKQCSICWKACAKKTPAHLMKGLKHKHKQCKSFRLGFGARKSKHMTLYQDITFPGCMLMLACLPHPEALSTLTCSLVLASWPLGSSPSSQCSPSVTSIIAVVRKMALTWWGRRKLPLLPYAGNCQWLLEAKAGFFSCQETSLFPELAKNIKK